MNDDEWEEEVKCLSEIPFMMLSRMQSETSNVVLMVCAFILGTPGCH